MYRLTLIVHKHYKIENSAYCFDLSVRISAIGDKQLARGINHRSFTKYKNCFRNYLATKNLAQKINNDKIGASIYLKKMYCTNNVFFAIALFCAFENKITKVESNFGL